MDKRAYYLVNLAPRDDPKFCFLETPPPGDRDFVYRLSMGEPVGEEYPKDFSFYMDGRNSGFKLPSLIGNTFLLLMVHRDLKEAIASVNAGDIEFKPFLLFNQKKKLASKDYVIVNPLAAFDVLDEERNEVTDYGDDDYWLEGQPVLSREKLEGVPDVFRLREDVSTIIFSSTLVDALRPLRPTNILAVELEVTEPEESGKPGKPVRKS